MHCPKCGFDNPGGMKFCGECTTPLTLVCPNCHFENPPGFKFCGQCTTALGSDSAKPQLSKPPTPIPESDSAAALDGERKTVTALFADIKGSTELMESLDPEEARTIVDPALRIMVEAVRSYEGYVVQSTGDGIFALFGAPAAYEDHPQRGLYAALQMQQQMREYARRLVNQGRPELEARFGINTGEVVVRTIETGGKVEYTPIGHTANLASRLQTLAPSGSIVVSEATRRLVEGYFELRTLGQMQVRGVAEPIEIYEVIGRGPLRTHFEVSARRGLTRFVGREREQQQMQHSLGLAMSGHGQIVAVVAEAGTGKSRLFHEFKVTLPPECKVLEAYSVSHGKSSGWLPVLEILRAYFGIQDVDDTAARREKVRARVIALEPTFSEALPYLWGLLGIQEGPDPLAQMDAPIRRQRTLDAIKRIVTRESLNQPTIVIFEDLQWIDSETQALLDLLADSIADVRLMLLLNYRPEYGHEWSGRVHYLELRLEPLGGESAAAMLEALLGNGADLDSIKREVTDRTGGNPFFIEEMVRALYEQGILAQNGTVKLVRPLGEAHLPVTVQGVLAARIDRLQAGDRDLLHTLAVLGREFPLGLVQRVAAVPADELELGLARLQTGEFIHEQQVSGDIEFAFKHALTQEVAYNSILVERRKILHQRIALAIEALFRHRLDDHLAELARHYSQSGDAGKAAHFLRLAGEQAAQRSAHEEAIGFFKAALAMVARLAENQERLQTQFELNFALLSSLATSRGYAAAEVEGAANATLELTRQLNDPQLQFLALMFKWAFHQIRRDLPTALQIAERLLESANEARDPFMIVHANYASGSVSLYRGEIRAAVEKLENARTSYRPGSTLRQAPQDPGVVSLTALAMARWVSGYPDRALQTGDEAISLAHHLAHPLTLAMALTYQTLIHLCRREASSALKIAEEARDLTLAGGFQYWNALASTYRGIAISAMGNGDQGINAILEGIASYRATGSELGAALIMVGLASSYLNADRIEEVLATVAQGLATTAQTGARLSDAELCRLKGEALLRRGSSYEPEARSCFEAAIATARSQEARAWELRATRSLARLIAQQGRRDEARAMLAEIYNWFTEGFDTADLKDAKALLKQLSAG